MIYTQVALLITLVATSFAYEKEGDVFVLKTSDYDSWTQEYSEYLRVSEFYAPWCGHCKSLAPHYTEAAQILANQGSKIVLAKIDATVEESLAQRFGVQGFPTLKMYLPHASSFQDYNGPREAQGIVSYLQGQVDKNILLSSLKDLEVARNKHQDLPLVVGVFSEERTALWQQYNQMISERDQVFRFAHFLQNQEVMTHFDIQTEGILVFQPLLTATEAGKAFASKSQFANKDDLNNWLDENILKLFVIPYPPVQEHMKSKGIPFGLLVTQADFRMASKQVKYYYNRLRKLSEQNDNLIIGVIDNSIMGPFLNSISRANAGGIFTIYQGQENYVMDEDAVKNGKFQTEVIQAFITKFKKGELEPNLKSQSIPAEEYENNVRVLVRKNIKSFLDDRSKDLFILFYAPWCGHCKSLKPIYEELGAQFKDSSVVIAKYDATENDIPAGFSVEGYPTLYFVPAHSKNPIPYNDDRKLDALVKFVEKNRESKDVKSEF